MDFDSFWWNCYLESKQLNDTLFSHLT